MIRRHLCLALGLLALLAFATSPCHGQLLYSWEGSTEGWSAESGFTIANTGGTNGVTDGFDSLEVNIPDQNFQRWGSVDLGAQQLADLTAAAAFPLTRRIEFDVTYDTDAIPQGAVTFVNQQIAFQTDQGWSQVDFATVTDGQTTETVRYVAPLSRFSSVNDANTSAQILMAVNSDWGADLSGTIYYDNLKIEPIVPDLDENMLVNPDDWAIFIGAHNTDLSGLTQQQQFLMGDLDSDGDNDFDDFLVFEAGYDEANGPGAFQALIPEPGTSMLVLLGLAGVTLLRRHLRILLLLIAVTLGFTFSRPTEAQIATTLLNSWETGLENWMAFSGGAIPGSVAVSTIGATDGTQSLGVTQDEDTFSWQAQVNYGGGSDQYNAIADAVDVGINNFALEFDVTFDTGSIPQGPVSMVSTWVALNSNGGWFEYGGVDGRGVASSPGDVDETIHVSIPLDQAANPPTNGTGTWVPGNETGFYQVNFGLDGDWGVEPATFYFDNLELVQLTEPDVMSIEVDRSTGEITLQNPGSGSFDVNYYTITSPDGSLDRIGWNSLDDQDFDAVDGPDPDPIPGDSPTEGWDEAGGSNANNLTEAFLLQMSTFGPMFSRSLGEGYNESMNAENVEFYYRDLNRPNVLTEGDVFYVGEPPAVDGDFDNNGLYECADVDWLVEKIVDVKNGGTDDLNFDLTGDGNVNNDDLDAWLVEAGDVGGLTASGNPLLEGDATLDGTVDGQDFIKWNDNKFTSVAAWCAGDFNADGTVDGQDFVAWNTNKFMTADGVHAVPEPSIIILLLPVALTGLLIRRTRL